MDKQLLKKIKDIYSLSETISAEKVEKGFLSENYKISTRDKDYFLKKYRFEDKGKIQEVHSSKKYFSEGGIPVIMPIETKDERTFFEYGGSYFALFPFVSGLQPERGDFSNEMIISLGKTLGQIHLLGRKSPLKMKRVFSGWDKEESLQTAQFIEDKLSKVEDKSDFDVLAQKVVAFKRELIEKNNINFSDLHLESDHLIHGDYLDQNVFFDKEGSIKYVFDFEKTKLEPRTQELFRSATYSFLDTDFDEISIKNVKLYIKSYLEVYPMEEQELKDGLIAHYLKSVHSFWVEEEHYLKNNNRVDLFLEHNYKRLRFMSERLEDLL